MTEISVLETPISNSLLDEIYERYSDLIDLKGLNTYSLSYKSNSLIRDGIEGLKIKQEGIVLKESDVRIETGESVSPRKPVLASCSIVLSNKNIERVGDELELEKTCKNVQEADLSNNKLSDWDEIKKLIFALKKLRLLNLSLNPLSNARNKPSNYVNNEKNEDYIQLLIDYFNSEWSIPSTIQSVTATGSNLETLILNSCYIDLKIVECLIDKLINLNELHLSSNNYSTVSFKSTFVKNSIKILYFSNNNLNNWNEVLKLGKCFPNLENLAISENSISDFGFVKLDDHDAKEVNDLYISNEAGLECDAPVTNASCFKNLKTLIMNKINVTDWASMDQLVEFPQLKRIRMQNIPLLNRYNDEQKYYLLVGHLKEQIDTLNGGKISAKDKDNCERKYIRHFMDLTEKPNRYYELESKHGKLDKLVDVNLGLSKTVSVMISFGDKKVCQNIDVRQSVGEFKKSLESFVGHPASKFRIYHVDDGAPYGPDELKLPNVKLLSVKVKDGDSFEIDLKPDTASKSKT